ncbi:MULTISPECIES: type II toxin-antitoxin system PemK/MazF family toxin [Bacillales]|jgi:mRNA interferase MazF|uniref:mRNA interferase n=1 Tax=Mammaliicoccus lentus TaxID=42858 RepID=A0AAP1RV06_MAMLE|nr:MULTISPECIES: type II toxin-antitoxin system PemK/MazF family toxin [Mammaliicoccus]HBV04950.1 type II toxin-antitoxin system PemK/MazF family toxin [Staphylococcus sp.]MBF0748078.1 type II toxin-antitoxin system PemK/MazF family toxin [Mammaliicoccus lentus]MBF0794279.1 type II toxin-antitoxin system PemK/MazF family toxin [Mammaliicoccus lentus]MBF0842963.1 type II toxin-antitoxin system PemK/MazF family toxin [Mammaliicoccus lentus]MBU6115069.1 type II toxin-antitoxin system PemK/MazF fa
MRRGDVYLADLSPVTGSEQGGTRPVVIIQNDTGNRYSPTVIVAAITGKINKAKIPTHVEIEAAKYKLDRDSVILLEQIRTIDKKRLKEKLTYLSDAKMKEVDSAIAISLNLTLQYKFDTLGNT